MIGALKNTRFKKVENLSQCHRSNYVNCRQKALHFKLYLKGEKFLTVVTDELCPLTNKRACFSKMGDPTSLV